MKQALHEMEPHWPGWGDMCPLLVKAYTWRALHACTSEPCSWRDDAVQLPEVTILAGGIAPLLHDEWVVQFSLSTYGLQSTTFCC